MGQAYQKTKAEVAAPKGSRLDLVDPGRSALAVYLQEIHRIPTISRSDEEVLARRASGGDIRAKEDLIKANLRFVVSVVKKYQNLGLPLSDLINEGNIGLIKAVAKFDVSRGYRFISYAIWWIKQSILKAIAEQSRLVRLPVNKANILVQIKKMLDQCITPADEKCLMEDIAIKLHSNLAEVKALLALSKEPLPLDYPVIEQDDSTCYCDTIADSQEEPPEEEPFRESLKAEIKRALGLLTKREAEVIQSRFGLNDCRRESLAEIGRRYRLTKERIRQIERKALEKLRRRSTSLRLKSFI